MKEALGVGPVGRQGWRDVRAGQCPVCRHRESTWCQVSTDGRWCLCKYVASDRAKTNADGVEYFVHSLDGEPGWTPPRGPSAPHHVHRAEPAVLHVAHGAVLDELDLAPVHRDGLRARGLTDATIDANGYRTLRAQGRAALARSVIDRVGEDVAATIPGMHVVRDGARSWWSFGGPAGLVVPCRDVAGRIVALKVRRDDPGDGPRYLYISSARHDGPGAVNAVHVPRFAGSHAEVYVTEGELKADVSTELSGVLTVSVPGVGAHRGVGPILAALGAERVSLAFDMDRLTNPTVAAATAACVRGLRAGGFPGAGLLSWNPQFKGLDDYYLAVRRGAEVSRGEG